MERGARENDPCRTGVGLDHWGGDFPSTHWSVIVAENDHSNASQQALGQLAGRYWYPLYAYLRRRGHSAHDAQDLLQGFYASLLESDGLKQACAERGRFRSYVLGALNHYVSKVRAKAGAQKRGGGTRTISIDQEMAEARYHNEPRIEETPERIYERQWAMTLLQQVMEQVEREYREKGQGTTFDTLSVFLSGDAERGYYKEVAQRLQTTEVNVRTKVKRLRQRFRALMHQSVAQLVDSAEDVEKEVRLLFQAVS